MNFFISILKSIFRSQVRSVVNDSINNSRKWTCHECQEEKTHRAQKFNISNKIVCTRCKRKLIG